MRAPLLTETAKRLPESHFLRLLRTMRAHHEQLMQRLDQQLGLSVRLVFVAWITFVLLSISVHSGLQYVGPGLGKPSPETSWVPQLPLPIFFPKIFP